MKRPFKICRDGEWEEVWLEVEDIGKPEVPSRIYEAMAIFAAILFLILVSACITAGLIFFLP